MEYSTLVVRRDKYHDGFTETYRLEYMTLQENKTGPGFECHCVAQSPDGKLLAFPISLNTVAVWNIEKHELLHLIEKAHVRRVWAVAFSPNGKLLASVGKSIRLWSTTTGQFVQRIAQPQPSWCIAFSPKHHNLIASALWQNTVAIWNIDAENAIQHCCHGGEVWRVEFTFNGDYLLSGSYDHCIKVWHGDTFDLLHTIKNVGACLDFLLRSELQSIFLHLSSVKRFAQKSQISFFSKETRMQPSLQNKYISNVPNNSNQIVKIFNGSIVFFNLTKNLTIKTIQALGEDDLHGLMFLRNGVSIVLHGFFIRIYSVLNHKIMALFSAPLFLKHLDLYIVLRIVDFIVASEERNAFENEQEFYTIDKIGIYKQLQSLIRNRFS